jgi:hypothetical protein
MAASGPPSGRCRRAKRPDPAFKAAAFEVGSRTSRAADVASSVSYGALEDDRGPRRPTGNTLARGSP